jgi:hypothetical protein
MKVRPLLFLVKKKGSARCENCVRDARGLNRSLDVVSTQDVRAFQNESRLRGQRTVETVLGWSVFSVSCESAADE